MAKRKVKRKAVPKRKAVHKKRKAVSGVKKHRKSPLKGKKHTHYGSVSAHRRRVNGLAGHKRKKRKKGIGGVKSGSMMNVLIGAAVGFGISKLIGNKSASTTASSGGSSTSGGASTYVPPGSTNYYSA